MNTRPRILVVDDLPANIGKLFSLLHEKYDVVTALSGKKALEVAQSDRPPDLILLDCLMPEITGYQVCEILQDDPKTAHIPIIFVTSLDSENEEEKGLKLGAVDYIIKPFRPAIILARIENHLKLKEYQDLLRRQSRADGLTGVLNRRTFDESLSREWERGARLGSPLSVILIDVDLFKNYNDLHGHLTGDQCLKWIAECLCEQHGRSSDMVARYGGEEFVCLLSHTDLAGAEKVAEKMRKGLLEKKYLHGASRVSPYLTISQGVACTVPSTDSSPKALLEAADRALYQAKLDGRNCVRLAQRV